MSQTWPQCHTVAPRQLQSSAGVVGAGDQVHRQWQENCRAINQRIFPSILNLVSVTRLGLHNGSGELRVRGDGTINLASVVRATVSCSLRLHAYPHDTQVSRSPPISDIMYDNGEGGFVHGPHYNLFEFVESSWHQIEFASSLPIVDSPNMWSVLRVVKWMQRVPDCCSAHYIIGTIYIYLFIFSSPPELPPPPPQLGHHPAHLASTLLNQGA